MQRYTPSGTVPLTGAIHTVLAGLSVAAIGGLLYAFLAYWLSWGPLRLLLMLGYSLAVGGMIEIAANQGKIRSPLFNTVLALVAVALGMWVYWGGYEVARHGMAVAPTAWTPGGLKRNGEELFEKGSFTMKRKQKAKGWLLVAVWIAEGVCVTGIIVAVARSEAQRPFCETCLAWTDSTKGLMHLAADGQEPAWQEVLAGDLPALAVFQPASADTSPHVRLDLARCPKCEHSNFVSLTAVTITKDNKGNDKTKERSLIVNGAISDPEAVFLHEFAQQMQGANLEDVDDEDDDDEADDEAK